MVERPPVKRLAGSSSLSPAVIYRHIQQSYMNKKYVIGSIPIVGIPT